MKSVIVEAFERAWHTITNCGNSKLPLPCMYCACGKVVWLNAVLLTSLSLLWSRALVAFWQSISNVFICTSPQLYRSECSIDSFSRRSHIHVLHAGMFFFPFYNLLYKLETRTTLLRPNPSYYRCFHLQPKQSNFWNSGFCQICSFQIQFASYVATHPDLRYNIYSDHIDPVGNCAFHYISASWMSVKYASSCQKTCSLIEPLSKVSWLLEVRAC